MNSSNIDLWNTSDVRIFFLKINSKVLLTQIFDVSGLDMKHQFLHFIIISVGLLHSRAMR